VRVNRNVLAGAMAAAVACMCGLAGCEGDDSKGNPVAISPTAATIGPGDVLELTVHGGSVTAWHESHPGWGRIKAIAPNRVTYTSAYTPGGADELQILKADVTVSVDPPRSATAEAYITHRGAQSSSTTTTTTTTGGSTTTSTGAGSTTTTTAAATTTTTTVVATTTTTTTTTSVAPPLPG
jgi:hypothetical protein